MKPGRRSKKTQADAVAQEQREECVAEMYAAGLSLRKIGLALNVDKRTVQRDLQAIRARWKEGAQEEWLNRVMETDAALSLAKADAWAAWQASKGVVVVETKKSKASGDEQEAKSSISHGDPRYLAAFQTAVEARARLFGLNAPSKVEATVKNADRLPPTREQMRAEVLAVLDRMKEVQARSSRS